MWYTPYIPLGSQIKEDPHYQVGIQSYNLKDGCDELLSVSLFDSDESEAIDSDDLELSELEDPLYK